MQDDINVVAKWFSENCMPLSIANTLIMHCGRHQHYFTYAIQSLLLNFVDHFADLGVQRTPNGDYSDHCAYVASKASKASGSLRRVFLSSSKVILWPAFKIYVLPILNYYCQTWKTNIVGNIQLLEKVQRRFS